MRARALTIDGLRELRSTDARFQAIRDTGTISVEEAYSRAAGPTWTMQLAESRCRGFRVYRPADVMDQLLISAASFDFRHLTNVKQSNRHQVVAAVLEILREGIPYSVHRFDISSFYESISRAEVENRLHNDVGLPRTAVRVARSLFRGCDAQSVSGLPRGISFSAALSEDYLRPIDRAIRLREGIFFYARYVDDMLMVTDADLPHTQLEPWMQDLLRRHGGLTLNKRKSLGHYIVGGARCSRPVAIDFLGYKIEMRTEADAFTKVDVDIANSKAKKIKTKVCLAVVSYLRNRDESLLRDRMKALTANYALPGHRFHHPPRVGIYYSYPRLSERSYESGALRDLDDFIHALFLGSKTKLSREMQSVLPTSTCNQLARLSFVDGHRTRRLERFDSRRIGKIMECWKHV